MIKRSFTAGHDPRMGDAGLRFYQQMFGKWREGFRRDLLPDPGVYYTRELNKLSRPKTDGWTSSPCPFHEDTRPSFAVNLQSGAWCCFAGCGRGDLVDFQKKRYGQDFKEAVQALGAWGPLL